MKRIKPSPLQLAFIISFFAVGVPYWLIPYNKVNLPDALMAPGLVLVGFSALLLRARGVASFGQVSRIVGASVPAAVFVRVIVDCIKDPTSHNLWPFEIVIAALVGFACAVTGSIVGSVIARLFAKKSASVNHEPGRSNFSPSFFREKDQVESLVMKALTHASFFELIAMFKDAGDWHRFLDSLKGW